MQRSCRLRRRHGHRALCRPPIARRCSRTLLRLLIARGQRRRSRALRSGCALSLRWLLPAWRLRRTLGICRAPPRSLPRGLLLLRSVGTFRLLLGRLGRTGTRAIHRAALAHVRRDLSRDDRAAFERTRIKGVRYATKHEKWRREPRVRKADVRAANQIEEN
jgi:hypothetical protein